MAKIFITGSADGLGHMAAKLLIDNGHSVVLHARNEDRAKFALSRLPGAKSVLVGDLSDIDETKNLADQINKAGIFDAIIHNAGVYQASSKQILNVNTLAPYILTALVKRPGRLIYMSSGMHKGGDANVDKIINNADRVSYSDSKLHVLMLSMAVARLSPKVFSNAVDPGWVATKMGGAGAPDDLQKGFETQTWLATSNDSSAKVTGRYFYHKHESSHHNKASDITLQDKLLANCESLVGVRFRV